MTNHIVVIGARSLSQNFWNCFITGQRLSEGQMALSVESRCGAVAVGSG